MLAAEADPARPGTMDDHATYYARLKKAHSRKSGFWARFGEEEPMTPQDSRSRHTV